MRDVPRFAQSSLSLASPPTLLSLPLTAWICFQVSLVITAHALDRNVSAMFELVAEVMAGARWTGESEHLGMLLQRRAASAGAQLGSRGLSYATSTAAASIQAIGGLDDRMGGFHHVALLQRLAREKEAGVAEVERALSEIASHVLTAPRLMRCRVACQPGGAVAAAEVSASAFLLELWQLLPFDQSSQPLTAPQVGREGRAGDGKVRKEPKWWYMGRIGSSASSLRPSINTRPSSIAPHIPVISRQGHVAPHTRPPGGGRRASTHCSKACGQIRLPWPQGRPPWLVPSLPSTLRRARRLSPSRAR